MPALAMLPTLLKYWYVGVIIVLIAWVKIDSARLHSAQTALESTKAQVSVALKNNADLKSGTDLCNAKVEALKSAGDALQEQVARWAAAATTAKAEGDQKAGSILANKPKGNCDAIVKYGLDQAQSFSWPVTN